MHHQQHAYNRSWVQSSALQPLKGGAHRWPTRMWELESRRVTLRRTDVRWPCPQARLDTENWCGVLQEVALPGAGLADPAAFLPAAVQFANDRCWGNLSCSLFVSPQVLLPGFPVSSSACEG